jgi:CRP-like cAMP-binding protein
VLEPIAERAKLNRYKSDEPLFAEGDEGDTLHLIRRGSVAVSRQIGNREVVISYVAAGNYVGEMGLLGRTRRNATVRAAVPTETVSLDAESFAELMARNPALRGEIEAVMRKRLVAKVKASSKGGKPGQWSARKAQMVAKEYKAKGGGYTS